MKNSTALQKTDGNMPLGQQVMSVDPPAEWLVAWPALTDEQKAFAVAYVEEGYSVAKAAEALSLPVAACRKWMNSPLLKNAVVEVQDAVGEIEYLNAKWVNAQLLSLYPKLVGEEAVPFIDNQGVQVEARRFYPEVAMRVLEYVAPKASKGSAGGTNIQVNIDLSALGIRKVEVSG